MNLEDLYAALPVPLQNLACSLHGRRLRWTRYNRNFDRLLEEAEARRSGDPASIGRYRDRRLAAFVRHAAGTVPYYRRLFRELKLEPGAIQSLEDLRALPVLTKRTVQERPGEFQSEVIPPRRRLPVHTSGTTGAGLIFSTTLAAVQEQHAVWWRYWRSHGLPRGTWCAYFGGRSVVPLAQEAPPFWRRNVPGRQILFSGYHLSSATFPAYLQALREARPPWLHGYPSILGLLARLILETGSDPGYRPRWITTGAENLLTHQADALLTAFGTRPIQHYGMVEAIANFSGCRRGRLHLDEDFAAMELLPNPAAPGFRIIGTNFTNPSTPLLRYDAGDVASVDTGACDCGLPGRVVVAVDGRQEDYIILRNGARLGRMDHIFKDLTAIREAQIHQSQPGQVVVRVVRAPSYQARDETLLRKEFAKRVGDLAQVDVQYVDRLPRGPNGKLRFVVSEVPQGRIVEADRPSN